MKKMLLTIPAILLCAILVSAQKDTSYHDTRFRSQLGMNISPTLKFNENRLPWLDYRYFYSAGAAIRFQLGFDGSISSDNGETSTSNAFFFPSGQIDSTISVGPEQYSFSSVRLGHLWYWQQTKGLYFIAGVEGQFQYTNSSVNRDITVVQTFGTNNTNTFIVEEKKRSWSHTYGVIPTLGVAWFPSERMSLSLETGVGFFWGTEVNKSRNKQKQINSQNPSNQVEQETARHLKSNIVRYKMDPLLGLIIAFRI